MCRFLHILKSKPLKPAKVKINLNGKLYDSSEPIFGVNNRAFRYGDALFESIRVVNGKPCFIEDHFKRLKEGMKLLKMLPSSSFTYQDFSQQIEELIKENNITEGGRVRITVFRNEGGFYIPKTNEKSYLIEANEFTHNEYTLNSKGLAVDTYSEILKPKTSLSKIKSCNSLQYVLAGIYAKEKKLDECLLMNENNRICESISANVFLYKSGSLYTPALEEGCVAGVMRRQIIDVAKDLKINVFEATISIGNLLYADELFLSNATKGIQWVGSFRQKRYFNDTCKAIVAALNQKVVEPDNNVVEDF